LPLRCCTYLFRTALASRPFSSGWRAAEGLAPQARHPAPDCNDIAALLPKETERPAYHPAVMLKIYVYCDLNRVQSAIRLERECLRNVGAMYLTGCLAPDFTAGYPQGLPRVRRGTRAGWAIHRHHRCHRRQQIQSSAAIDRPRNPFFCPSGKRCSRLWLLHERVAEPGYDCAFRVCATTTARQ
jgi:hypothetical protein